VLSYTEQRQGNSSSRLPAVTMETVRSGGTGACPGARLLPGVDACPFSPVMGPLVFGQGGPLPEMMHSSFLVKNATTIWVSRHGSSSDGHLPFQARGVTSRVVSWSTRALVPSEIG
jgi:hypothetical protein